MRTFILLLLMQLVSLPFSYARQPDIPLIWLHKT